MATPASISTARFTVSMLSEFHHRLDLDPVLPENLVHGLARRDVGIKADELVARQRSELHLVGLGQRMARMRDEHEDVAAEGNHLGLGAS